MTAGVVLLLDAYSGFGGFAGILVPLFFYIACHGFVLPNTTALAMAPHGRVAGSASALLGTFQFVGGAIAGSLVGAFANGTPVPMAAVVAGCGATAFSGEPVRDRHRDKRSRLDGLQVSNHQRDRQRAQKRRDKYHARHEVGNDVEFHGENRRDDGRRHRGLKHAGLQRGALKSDADARCPARQAA